MFRINVFVFLRFLAVTALMIMGPSGLALAVDRPEPLSAEEAFRFSVRVDEQEAIFSWNVMPGYHLYQKRLKFSASSPDVALGAPIFPPGKIEKDVILGLTEVYRGRVEVRVPVLNRDPASETVTFDVSYQGCQDAGSCYPPTHKRIPLVMPEVPIRTVLNSLQSKFGQRECVASAVPDVVESEQCRIFRDLKDQSFWFTSLSFFGMGLLLAFTPCVFPMIPILSGIIAGRGNDISTRLAFKLSLSYVLASALTYTVFGVLAGAFGHNLQTLLQRPAVIGTFSALFVLLSLSMFDVYTLQVPESLQNRLTLLSNRQRGGTWVGSAIMGVLSTLIVGPCVAAPMAGALIYIGETGDAILGGAALFCLGAGMGLPLLIIGTSAGRYLPKAGEWMQKIKGVFGLGLLGVALMLLQKIVAPHLMLILGAFVLMQIAIFLGAMEALPENADFFSKTKKGFAVLGLVYASLLLVGGMTKAQDPLNPLENISVGSRSQASHSSDGLQFKTVKSAQEFDATMQLASQSHQRLMLDFYADWCAACQEMEEITFKDPRVVKALNGAMLVKVDLTDHGNAKELLKIFHLVGPPATLFFDSAQKEDIQHRVVGFLPPDEFLVRLKDWRMD